MAKDSVRRMHNDAVDLTHEDDSRHIGLERDVEGRTPIERQMEEEERVERVEDGGAPDDLLGDLLMEGAMVIVDISVIVDGNSYPLQGVIEHIDRGKGYLILKQQRETSAETRRVLIPWHAINFIASGWE
jgi:hypothetical protein